MRAQRLELSADTVVQRLARIARTNIYDFLDFRPDGTFRLDFLKATSEQTAGVARLTIREHRRKGKTIFKTESLTLADRVRSLELLGRHLGLFEGTRNEEHVEFARNVKQLTEALGLDRLTDEQLQALEAALEKPSGQQHDNGAPATNPSSGTSD